MKSIFLTVMLLMVVSLSMGAILIVPTTYSDITVAVAAAVSGDTIQVVQAGSYSGNGLTINKNLTIAGTVSGITVANQCTILGNITVAISNLLFVNQYGQGIVMQDTSNVSLANCTFANKTSGWGIYINGPATVSAVSCTIVNNNPGAVEFYGKGNLSLNYCVITANAQRSIVIDGAGVLNMQNTLDQGNQVGVVVQTVSGATVNISNSQIINEGQVGVWLLKAGFVTVTNSTISGNYWDNIRAGNDASNNGKGSIINCNNVVLNSGRMGALIMGPGISVSLTSCKAYNNRETGVLYSYIPAGDNTPCSFNFVDSDFSGNTISGFAVGGAYYMSSVTAIRTKFNNNINHGFATFDLNGNCKAYFSGCEFAGNKQNAIFLNTNNVSSGYNSVYIERSKFVDGSNNTYTQLAWLRSWSEVTIVNCIFDEGKHQLWNEGVQARVYHCDFVTSTKSTLNAIHNEWLTAGKDETFINNIFSGASIAFQTYNNTTVIFNGSNNILNNITKETAGTALNAGSLAYTAANPLFVTASSGPNTGNFHLQLTSPAIFMAYPYLNVANDFEGNPRPMPIGSNPDIGAYEEQTKIPTVDCSLFTDR